MLPTIAITPPELPAPLPRDQQALMDIFYNRWQALSQQVANNNRALHPQCDEVFVARNIEGMLRSPTWEEIAAVMPPKVVAAVMLGNHNYQVHNGGFAQWDDNGYSKQIEGLKRLYAGAAAVGIENAQTALGLLIKFEAIKALNNLDDDYDDDDGSYSNPFEELDSAFYGLDSEKMMQDILDRFEDVISRTLTLT